MIPVAGVVIPLASQQVVVTHGHTVFLRGQIQTMRLRRRRRSGKIQPADETRRSHRSSNVVGLLIVPVGVEHRADPVAPGVLVLH